MNAQLICPDDSVWQEYLAQMHHDFYHLPGYVELCAKQEGGEPLAFAAQHNGHRFFVPLVARPIDLGGVAVAGLRDATSPYGYPAPLVSNAEREPVPAAFVEQAMSELLAALHRRGIVSVFLRLHPLMPLPLGPLHAFGELVHHGETVYVDLTRPEEELWHQTRSSFRNKINRAAQNGVVAEIDDEWTCFGEFFEIYTETMRRVNADDYYFFPQQYFHGLKEALGGALHLCVVRVRGKVASAALFSETCGIVQYHLSGMRSAYHKEQPTTIMIDFVRSWAKQRGNRVFHLGGGLGGKQDSLLRYKAGFSKLRSVFSTFRAVADADAYGRLVSRWEQASGTQADDPDGFFPVYRRPLSLPVPSAPRSELCAVYREPFFDEAR